MRQTVCLMVLLGLTSSAHVARAGEASAAANTPGRALVDGNTAFAVDLYRQLKEPGENLFFSPFSISSALAMTYGGAQGTTAVEMAEVLHFPVSQDELHPLFGTLNRRLPLAAEKTGQRLSIANGLCLTGGEVSDGFKELLRTHYNGELFGGDLEEINGWVSRKTEGKIPRILESLDPNSVCVLLNAIYFKGLWARPFKPDRTEVQPFFVDGGKVQVQIMSQTDDFRLLRGNNNDALALPYRGQALSMVILLPRRHDGLEALENMLTPAALGHWLARLDAQRVQEVRVELPRFKLETSYGLAAPCRALGMREAFERNVADFRGMGWPKGDLWISQIKHKAFVEVNEEGTEAAAATAVEMGTFGIPEPPPVFRADHPFLFLIRDHQTGTILFMGRLAHPAQGG